MNKYYLSLLSALFFIPPMYAADCIPTPHRTTGTHYKPVTRQAINIGKGVIVHGRILSATNCKPIANAKIAHWQTGEEGTYLDHLRAYMYTDKNGHFQFETEWPNMPLPHIHFIVTAKGHDVLETQWIGGKRQTTINFDMVLQEN